MKIRITEKTTEIEADARELRESNSLAENFSNLYGRIDDNNWLFDGVCQYGSYGAKNGMIEAYGELGHDASGNPQVMTAEEAFAIIKADWDERRKQ